ncbi:hypothetical protein FACS189430_01260 [Bacteroidia bacterium]|nr:hypothetical protein FACS189430_01260 [Bacteroidia bacterium]
MINSSKLLKIATLSVAVVFAACTKEKNTISREQADAEVPPVSRYQLSAKTEGDLYAYSEIELNVFAGLANVRIFRGVPTYCTYDATADINGQAAPVRVEVQGETAKIFPDAYYASSGTLNVVLNVNIMYSTSPDNRDKETGEWLLLRTEKFPFQYQVHNKLFPDQQKIFYQPETTEINTSIYYVPSIKIQTPAGETAHGFKYEIQPSLTSGSVSIPLQTEQTDDRVSFLIDGTLENGTRYDFSATAKWSRLVGSEWKPCDNVFNETLALKINANGTNLALPTLSEDDIEFSYPLNKQMNFLRKEYDKGYFKLKDRALMRLLATTPHMLHIRFDLVPVASEGISAQEEIVYNSSLNVAEYAMPIAYFDNEKVYRATIMNSVTNEPVYTYYFKTSKFDNFTEKWEVYKTCFEDKWRDRQDFLGLSTNTLIGVAGGNAITVFHSQKINIKGNRQENLDSYEAEDDARPDLPLIQFETHVDESWKNTVDWLIYGQPSLTLDRRDMLAKKYGFPPTKAIFYYAEPALLSDDNCVTGLFDRKLGQAVLFWGVQICTRYDYFTANNNAWKIPAEQRTQWQQLAVDWYPNLPYLNLDFAIYYDGKVDTYPLLDVFYVLPGIKIETTIIRDIQL